MIRYNLLEARRMILTNVGTYSILTYFHFGQNGVEEIINLSIAD